jgi:predicted acetyltransferase
MSEIEIRTPGPDEFEAFGHAIAAAFVEELHADEEELARRVVDPTRDLGAYDGDAMVGTAGSYAMRLRVPGGEVAAAGVTAVGVAPTHRRRGIMTQLMRRQLDDTRDRGEPVAILWASEAGIYQRFGYGLATVNARIDAERDRSTFHQLAEPRGTMRLVSKEEAAEVFPRVYDRAQAVRPGFVGRTHEWWASHVLPDLEHWRGRAGPQHRVLLEVDGSPEGYALYRLEHAWAHGYPEGTLHVQEAVGASPLAARELWRFLLGMDLVACIKTRSLAPDDPVFLLVAEPSRLRFRLGDGIWLRLVDVAAALEARSYAARGSVTLELRDDFCDWNAGRWRLDVGSGTPAVDRVESYPDLRLTTADLAAVYLGAFSFSNLEQAGRVEELSDGAIARADALFHTDRAPWSPGMF